MSSAAPVRSLTVCVTVLESAWRSTRGIWDPSEETEEEKALRRRERVLRPCERTDSLPAVHFGRKETALRRFPSNLVEMSGFDFSNVLRNAHIGSNGPQARSTGTTIVGCLFDGGIVLGADSYAFAPSALRAR